MIFWPLRVNAAIAGFGIPPDVFTSDFRSEIQYLGKKAHLTPHETALVLISLGISSSLHLPLEFEQILFFDYKKGKVNIGKPEVIDSLDILGMTGIFGVQVAYPTWHFAAVDFFRGELDEFEIEELGEYGKSPIGQLFAQYRWKQFSDEYTHNEDNSSIL